MLVWFGVATGCFRWWLGSCVFGFGCGMLDLLVVVIFVCLGGVLGLQGF